MEDLIVSWTEQVVEQVDLIMSPHLSTEEVAIYVKQEEKQENIGVKVGFLDIIEPINMMWRWSTEKRQMRLQSTWHYSIQMNRATLAISTYKCSLFSRSR